MNANEFLAGATNGEIPIDSHKKLLQIAYIYSHRRLRNEGVFDFIEKLYQHGWTFGQGPLKYNRTLDIFYLTQISAGLYRSVPKLQGGDFKMTSIDDFERFFTEQLELIHQDVWKKYYSEQLMNHPSSARFWRLPDLQDLADATDPIFLHRRKTPGLHNKLPRWASIVSALRQEHPGLSADVVTELALSTLRQSISHKQKEAPSIPSFSRTQACFWLKHMKVDAPLRKKPSQWCFENFGVLIGQGYYDVWDWQADYSPALWNSSTEAFTADIVLEPDRDGKRESEVQWCGWPDGGASVLAWRRGWDPELGSDEELAFLVAIAEEETKDVQGIEELDYSLTSHLFLAVVFTAGAADREQAISDLTQNMVKALEIDESKAYTWVKQALKIVEPYVSKLQETSQTQSQLLRQILEENGQLFARWKLSPSLNEFNFELAPRQLLPLN